MRYYILLYVLLTSLSGFGATTLGGDATTGDTFNFAAHKLQRYKRLFFVVANEALANNRYSVALVGSKNTSFLSLVNEKTTVNNVSSQSNPLYGAKISDMYLTGTVPVLVKDGAKVVTTLEGIVYANSQVNVANTSLLQSVTLNGSNSSEINSILKVAGGGGVILAAVTGSGTFGDAGSGIALINSATASEEIEKDGEKKTVTNKVLDVVNAATGVSGGNVALALTGATGAIKVGNDATINSNVVDMYYSSDLGRYYIALDLTSGGDSTDKVRAVAVGRISNSSKEPVLNLDEIVVDGAISGEDQIVAAEGASKTVAISKVRTITTTTHLNYLIVAGGNGTSGNTVYALPLVNRSKFKGFNLHSDTTHGTLAQASQTPTDEYTSAEGAFVTRYFLTPASSSSDLLTDSDDAAMVGAGALPIGASDSIDDIFVGRDAVFASVSDDSGSNEAGLWHSQAIFDNEGKVAKWTSWQKVAGTTGKVFGAGLDPETSNYVYITENGAGEAKIVKRTKWSDGAGDSLLGGTNTDGSNGLLGLVYTDLPQSEGGVQGYSFFKSTGLTSNFNILCATGLNKVLLGKTRSSSGSITGDFLTNSAVSIDGSMPTATSSTNYASISGGNLKDIGPITASAIADNGSGYWLVVGGANGAAILADGSGDGWTSTISDFSGISGSFKKIANFPFVRKIISDSNYLYILSEKGLYRTALTSSAVLNNSLTFTTLAEVSDNNSPSGAAFFDVLISGDLCLLATSLGLYRTGNSQSISSASNAGDVSWTQVTVPDGLNSIFKLVPISSSLEESGFASKGQVYVLSAYVGYHLAKLNRLYVNLSGSVGDSTVTVVPDRFYNTGTSYLVNFGEFRSSFFTTGASFISTRSADVAGDMAITLLSSEFRSGNKFLDASSKDVTIDLSGFYQVGNLSIVPYLGSTIVNGDFGFRVNE